MTEKPDWHAKFSEEQRASQLLGYKRYVLMLAAEIGLAAERISDKDRLVTIVTKLEVLREELLPECQGDRMF